MSPIDVELRDAYLRRLGVELEPPSVDALFALHRAHAERVAYETLWIQAGDRWGVDAMESTARIARRRRGGYCFHLNGAFSELLRTLGYHVDRHVGGVHGPDGPADDAMTNHLVLTVGDLPSDGNPAGTWYVDVGLGDALHEPLPLVAGTYRSGPFVLVLDQAANGVADWHLTHDPGGSFPGMAWRSAPADMDAFADRNVTLSTAPDSGFVKYLSAQRRDAAGVDILRSLSLMRVGEPARATTTLETANDLFDALGDVFGLDVTDLDAATRARVWARVHDAHLQWLAERRAE